MNKLHYVAHQFGGDPMNLLRASRWTAELCRVLPGQIFWAPWIPLCQHWPNEGDTLERGMELDIRCVRASRSVVQVGPSLSTGMRRESVHGHCVHNLIGMPIEKLEDVRLVAEIAMALAADKPFDFGRWVS